MEHIEDDRGELARVASLLAPGGHVLTFSPALPWLYGKLDARVGHYRRYYLGEMKDKMRSARLDLVRAHYFDMPGALLWWLRFRLFQKRKLRGNLVGLYDRWIIPVLRYLEPSLI